MTNLGYVKFLFYWHSNEEWYVWDEETKKFSLTEKAPQKAIDSFEAWNGN